MPSNFLMKSRLLLSTALCGLLLSAAHAQSDVAAGAAPAAPSADDLAKQLANPVASLISVPFQSNFDFGLGANDGWRYTLNVQPVIPVSLNEKWNLISRTIVPLMYQNDVVGTGSQSGLGDIVQSVFFSPKDPTESGWILGAGPVLLIPTATNDFLGGKQWGAGPTIVALRQDGAWTTGALVNHLASFAGSDSRAYINATYFQPFATMALSQGRSVTFSTESTYDWNAKQWTIPLVVVYSKVTKIGGQLASVAVGAKYFAEKPAGGPDWGFRVAITLLYPR